MNEEVQEFEELEDRYGFEKLWKGRTDPSKTQKTVSYEKKKRRRFLEKQGRKNNRYSHKGQKSGTGRKNW